jgi:hypothetical protein
MSVATSAEGILNGVTSRPKQCKLLGATVRGLGVIVAVSSTLTYGYAIVEGTDRVNRRVAFTDLKRDEVEFPLEPQPFVTRVERVDYGVWDEVHSLVPAQPVVLAAAA